MTNLINFKSSKYIINLLSIAMLVSILVSCNDMGEKKQYNGNKSKTFDIEMYLSRANCGNNGDSVNIEDKIIDKIFELPEVKERAAYIKKETKGERHLEIWIAARPDENIAYYWIKAGEDNGMSLVTHFDFYVYPKTMTVKFYDVVENKVLSLSEWRRVSQ